MGKSNLYYSILLYIIIVSILVFTKPSFTYDKEQEKYKEFGTTDGKTIFTLPIISILTALLIASLAAMLNSNEKCNVSDNKSNPIQYIPIQYYPQMPYMFADPRTSSTMVSPVLNN